MTCSRPCSVWCFVSVSQRPLFIPIYAKAFLCWKADAQEADRSLRPETFNIGSSRYGRIKSEKLSLSLCHFINYPPNSAFLTDFSITSFPLMNESVFPLSVGVNHPPTSVSSFPKQPICPWHVSKPPRQVRCLLLSLQLFKVVLFLLLTDGRKKNYILCVRGIKHHRLHVGREAETGTNLTFTTCEHGRQRTAQQRAGRATVKNPAKFDQSEL